MHVRMFIVVFEGKYPLNFYPDKICFETIPPFNATLEVFTTSKLKCFEIIVKGLKH